jgi:CDP-paratose 2-epimerase
VSLKVDRILITGGCGFVGSNLALHFKTSGLADSVIAYDNMMRSGSELNKLVLQKHGIECVVADIRDREALNKLPKVDVVIDAAAEPSVLAGLQTGSKELLDINLGGTINCLELAKKWNSIFIFLSTNRVYPYDKLNALPYSESETRLNFTDTHQGVGIDEQFGNDGPKSLYGASKLAAEHLILEYHAQFQLRTIVNRFGVIAGPHQMGKVDQGIMALWVAHHYYKKPLRYIGFGGKGKQVRDILHIDDACHLIEQQLQALDKVDGKLYNAGGAYQNSTSLQELTQQVQKVVGNSVTISSVPETRPADVRVYYTDNRKLNETIGWQPKKTVLDSIEDIFLWIKRNESDLAKIFNQ